MPKFTDAEEDFDFVLDDATKKKSFDEWMRRPMTRMAMSMIPAGESREVLETLLRDCFDTAWGNGAGCVASVLARRIMDRK